MEKECFSDSTSSSDKDMDEENLDNKLIPLFDDEYEKEATTPDHHVVVLCTKHLEGRLTGTGRLCLRKTEDETTRKYGGEDHHARWTKAVTVLCTAIDTCNGSGISSYTQFNQIK